MYPINQYQQDCLRTKSPIYHPELVDRRRLVLALGDACATGETARELKRACFAGKELSYPFDARLQQGARLDGLAPDMLHSILGILNETGELAKMVYDTVVHDKPFDLTNFIEEAGDSLWFWMLGCHAAGISPEEVMRRNIAKLKARFPDKFEPDKTLDENRDHDAERKALEG